MNRIWSTIFIIVLLLAFIGYIIFDLVLKSPVKQVTSEGDTITSVNDNWDIEKIFNPGHQGLCAVAVSESGNIILGGKSFLSCYDSSYNLIWEFKPDSEIVAIASFSGKTFAASGSTVLIFNDKGLKVNEIGSFNENAIITSLSVNSKYVAIADADSKSIYIADHQGELKYLINNPDEPFIIPSPYFDVALGESDTIYIANTGKRRIEKRKTDGALLAWYGEGGMAPEFFSGCCNPAHIALSGQGFVTAEKGINRIKILDREGKYIEMVSSENNFLAPLPLDIAVSSDCSIIYGAYKGDSKLYVFKRKQL